MCTATALHCVTPADSHLGLVQHGAPALVGLPAAGGCARRLRLGARHGAPAAVDALMRLNSVTRWARRVQGAAGAVAVPVAVRGRAGRRLWRSRYWGQPIRGLAARWRPLLLLLRLLPHAAMHVRLPTARVAPSIVASEVCRSRLRPPSPPPPLHGCVPGRPPRLPASPGSRQAGPGSSSPRAAPRASGPRRPPPAARRPPRNDRDRHGSQ